MITYVAAFIFYTLAMIGIMFAGFIVYKKTFENSKGDNKGLIKIIDSTPIGNKKMLLVVKIKNERFLIASGVEHTTFLSKLENDNLKEDVQIQEQVITKEDVERSVLDEIYEENYMQTRKAPRFDDPQKIRAALVQKQFKELYEQDENEVQISKEAINKKEMMKELLKNLNASSNKINGSKF